MAQKTYDQKIIVERMERLGQLLASSSLPKPVIDAILEKSGGFSLRQVDLLIDALAREQGQWRDLEKLIPELEKIQNEGQQALKKEQEKIARDFIEKSVKAEEESEQAQLKKTIQES